jgi:Tfp pilus assembly protein PilP
MFFLVSCKEEPPSSSMVVSEHNNKQRIQIASTKLPLKTEKVAQKVSNMNVEVKKNIEKVIHDTDMKVEEDVDSKRSRFEEWRNPFKPFITKAVVNVADDSRPKSPLEKYDINELKLIAIIWGIKRPTAMIEDPDGTGYVVKKGTFVGDKKGRIVKILKDKVIVKEKYRDLLGNSQVEEVALELHNRLEEGRSL